MYVQLENTILRRSSRTHQLTVGLFSVANVYDYDTPIDHSLTYFESLICSWILAKRFEYL